VTIGVYGRGSFARWPREAGFVRVCFGDSVKRPRSVPIMRLFHPKGCRSVAEAKKLQAAPLWWLCVETDDTSLVAVLVTSGVCLARELLWGVSCVCPVFNAKLVSISFSAIVILRSERG